MGSTIPAAVAVLGGYMEAVATAHSELAPGVYLLGYPEASAANNFLMVGDWETAAAFDPTTYTFAAIPGATKLVYESYTLKATVRAASSGSTSADALACFTNAFTLLDSLRAQITSDIGGLGGATDGSTPLSPTGSWGAMTVTNVANGPGAKGGWLVVLDIGLQVDNAQLSN